MVERRYRLTAADAAHGLPYQENPACAGNRKATAQTFGRQMRRETLLRPLRKSRHQAVRAGRTIRPEAARLGRGIPSPVPTTMQALVTAHPREPRASAQTRRSCVQTAISRPDASNPLTIG